MAACAAAGVGVGSEDDGSDVLSCSSKKSSGGRRLQSLSTCPGDVVSIYGIVVLVGSRSGNVVKGFSACCCRSPSGWLLIWFP